MELWAVNVNVKAKERSWALTSIRPPHQPGAHWSRITTPDQVTDHRQAVSSEWPWNVSPHWLQSFPIILSNEFTYLLAGVEPIEETIKYHIATLIGGALAHWHRSFTIIIKLKRWTGYQGNPKDSLRQVVRARVLPGCGSTNPRPGYILHLHVLAPT